MNELARLIRNTEERIRLLEKAIAKREAFIRDAKATLRILNRMSPVIRDNKVDTE